MFSRGNRRPKRAKTKIYFTFGGCRGFRCGSLFGAVVVSTGCRWSGSLGLQELPECLRLSSGRVFPPFVRLSCFALGALLANMALFRIFRAF